MKSPNRVQAQAQAQAQVRAQPTGPQGDDVDEDYDAWCAEIAEYHCGIPGHKLDVDVGVLHPKLQSALVPKVPKYFPIFMKEKKKELTAGAAPGGLVWPDEAEEEEVVDITEQRAVVEVPGPATLAGDLEPQETKEHVETKSPSSPSRSSSASPSTCSTYSSSLSSSEEELVLKAKKVKLQQAKKAWRGKAYRPSPAVQHSWTQSKRPKVGGWPSAACGSGTLPPGDHDLSQGLVSFVFITVLWCCWLLGSLLVPLSEAFPHVFFPQSPEDTQVLVQTLVVLHHWVSCRHFITVLQAALRTRLSFLRAVCWLLVLLLPSEE